MSSDYLTCLDCRQPAQWRWSRATYVHVAEMRQPFPTFDHPARVFPDRKPSEADQERMEQERRFNFGTPCAFCGGPEPYVSCPNHAGTYRPESARRR